jgi:hypothetical protein
LCPSFGPDLGRTTHIACVRVSGPDTDWPICHSNNFILFSFFLFLLFFSLSQNNCSRLNSSRGSRGSRRRLPADLALYPPLSFQFYRPRSSPQRLPSPVTSLPATSLPGGGLPHRPSSSPQPSPRPARGRRFLGCATSLSRDPELRRRVRTSVRQRPLVRDSPTPGTRSRRTSSHRRLASDVVLGVAVMRWKNSGEWQAGGKKIWSGCPLETPLDANERPSKSCRWANPNKLNQTDSDTNMDRPVEDALITMTLLATCYVAVQLQFHHFSTGERAKQNYQS